MDITACKLMDRIEKEIRIVELMVTIYCRRREGNAELCPQCRALVEYARARLAHCRFGNSKGSCRRCPVHCYSPAMRSHIRKVMRFSGPRMILYHPFEFLRHI